MWAWLAIARHESFGSNAFDLGYITQTLWNTANGDPFRFTTLEGVPFSPDDIFDPYYLRRPHSLLAFHVEPILLLIAPLFFLWPDPRLLLVLQSVTLAAGALAAAFLAQRRLNSPTAGRVFGLTFLLSPTIAAAALSDFHTVALGSTLLMTTICLFAAGRTKLALIAALLTAITREDTAVAVSMLGLYLLFRSFLSKDNRSQIASEDLPPDKKSVPKALDRAARIMDPLDRQRRPGLILFAGAGIWALVSFGLIVPFFNGTISILLDNAEAPGSMFWNRYSWLGKDPFDALWNIVTHPGELLRWLVQGDVLEYFLTLVLNGGIVALLAPGALLIALPAILQNALSSFDWMRSGGAHYSVLIVPITILAGIEGCRRIFKLVDRMGSPHQNVIGGIVRGVILASVLGSAFANHLWLGASPLSRGLSWPAPSARDSMIQHALAHVPPDAAISATSSMYPHLSSRAKAYWFPAIQDAEFVVIDVAGSAHPLEPATLNERVLRLLSQRRYRIETVAPGLVVLARHASQRPAVLPKEFFEFVRASEDELHDANQKAISADFGGYVRIVGYRLELNPTITIFGPSANLTTYWRIVRPVPGDLEFTFYLTRIPDGAVIGEMKNRAVEPLWHPTSKWTQDEIIVMRVTIPRIKDLEGVGVGVSDPQTGQGLQVTAISDNPVWDDDTMLRVIRFDQEFTLAR